MNDYERQDVIDDARKRLGWGFYMIDPRQVSAPAAPFHIEGERDSHVFVTCASSLIPWQASRAPGHASEGIEKALHRLGARLQVYS